MVALLQSTVLRCAYPWCYGLGCPSILPGGGQAEVRVGGGPSGIVYGLQVPPQALVPAPRVGLNHADPEDRSGRSLVSLTLMISWIDRGLELSS